MNKTGFLAGGGTGGHIYPALAMAQAFKTVDSDLSIHFVGSKKGLESKIVPKEGYPLHMVSVGRLNSNVSIFERGLTILALPLAFMQSVYLLLRYRPKFVLGVGGYASAPVLLLASFFRIKTFIWEPNATPGLANRWLSRFVDEAFVVFPEAKPRMKAKKYQQVGMPVRGTFDNFVAEPAATGNQFRILVFGGSQGARGINEALSEAIAKDSSWLQGIEIVHQTGPVDFPRVSAVYEKLHELGLADKVHVFEYLHDMDKRLAWADLVICRSGTGTLSELAATGRPSVLVPFPYAADNHQQKNAEVLVNAGAAKMLLQKDLSADSLKQAILDLKADEPGRLAMAKKVKSFYQPGAARKIVEHIFDEIS
ncbi:MAG: undecaprenyldiphospho-muramoylpentapeptide beta-N-acetylglucosaminyltransferase [Bdellovibrionales bacterium]|nr:undecaprenyldiphospho-muramoylpentapeptide beta-N-acetylglucosaminyltransferase [Bdellovibrionales bacterium]